MRIPHPSGITLKAALVTLALVSATHQTQAAILAQFQFTGGSGAPENVSPYLSVENYSTMPNPSTGIGISSSGYAFVTGAATTNTTAPPKTVFHEITFTVQNLALGETLNLSGLSFLHSKNISGGQFSVGVYSALVGYTSEDHQLALFNAAGTTGVVAHTDLTSANSVAGSTFSSLTNGQTVSFRLHFADDQTAGGVSQRIDDFTILGTVVPEPSSIGLFAFAGAALLWSRRRG